MDAKSKIYKNTERKKYDITVNQRQKYREISQHSRLAKLAAEQDILQRVHDINHPLSSQISRESAIAPRMK